MPMEWARLKRGDTVKWRSVTEALPEAGQPVLLTDGMAVAIGQYGDFFDDWDGRYNWAAEGHGLRGVPGKFTPTYWAEITLPEQ